MSNATTSKTDYRKTLPPETPVTNPHIDVGACRRAADALDPRGDNNGKRRVLDYPEIGPKS